MIKSTGYQLDLQGTSIKSDSSGDNITNHDTLGRPIGFSAHAALAQAARTLSSGAA